MKIIKILALGIAFSFFIPVFCADNVESKVLKQGEKLCFVGDSITAGGWYTTPIMLYYATRFPNMKIDFRNIGIPGDTCSGILWRMDWDVLPQLNKEDSVCVLMIGMNDVGRDKYAKDAQKRIGAERFAKTLENTRSGYETRLSKVIANVSENSRRLIVFTPSIYDQIGVFETENLFGVNDELGIFGELSKRMASQFQNVSCVDMHSAMLKVNESYRKLYGSDQTIIGPDRIHPGIIGGFVMLDKWLSDNEETREVSQIHIDLRTSSTEKSFNCKIFGLEISKRKVSFACLENSLPLPVEKDVRKVLPAISGEKLGEGGDFKNIFSREILKIEGLEKGEYAVKIDGVELGSYFASELAEGINLAEYELAPQYIQALEVYKKCLEFRSAAGKYRSLFWVELALRNDIEFLGEKEKIEFVKKHLANAANESAYRKGGFKFYIENRGNKAGLFKGLQKIQEEIYTLAQPLKHSFVIEKL